MLWSRKSAPLVHDRSRTIGLDVTASRARAVSVGGGKVRTLVLDEPAEELALFLACDRRSPEPGRAGYAACRKVPHLVCSNFLPVLGQPRQWRAGAHVLSPDYALELCFEKARGPLALEADAAALTLPAYLTPGQVARAVIAATRARLPLKGTAAAPLAVAADHAAVVLTGRAVAHDGEPNDWVVPLRPAAAGPGSVLLIDADEFALSAALVEVTPDAVRLLGSACWPRAGVRVWKDRLLDAVADRCVRLCRRDPRDSADAEQALFEQLDDALDRARAGQRVTLTVRADRWYQDVAQQPDEFDGYCAALARSSAEQVRELAAGVGLPAAPRAVWLTHAAGRLPGLVKAIHDNTPAVTAVDVLPANAVARAAAALVSRWLAGELPRAHLDATIPISRESKTSTPGDRSSTRS